MKTESTEFQRGYKEAVSVFEAGFHPGYCRDSGESVRVTRSMLQAGLDGKEAQRQRSDFIAADRQRGADISRALENTQTGGETGPFIRPSKTSEWGHDHEALFARRQSEAIGIVPKNQSNQKEQ